MLRIFRDDACFLVVFRLLIHIYSHATSRCKALSLRCSATQRLSYVQSTSFFGANAGAPVPVHFVLKMQAFHFATNPLLFFHRLAIAELTRLRKKNSKSVPV